MCAVSTPRASNPVSTSRNAARLRRASPAPSRSTSAVPISAATSARRSRRRPLSPAVPRPAPCNEATRSGLDPMKPGSHPATSAHSTVRPIATASAPTSMWISSARANPGGFRVTSIRTRAAASPTPSAPPTTASSVLSASEIDIRCRRPAPSAARTAESAERARPRASNRLAKLTQAISATRATAASSTRRAGRASPTTISRHSSSRAPMP